MKRDGFTLVELLAMLVVLGILMAVAVPNITGILRNNKLNIVKSDAIKMMDTAKIKMNKIKEDNRPGNEECVVFALNYLNDSDDINVGPNGGEYYQFESFVIVKKVKTGEKTSRYKYYVRLVEDLKGSGFGIKLEERDTIAGDNTDYITNVDLGSDDSLLDGNKAEDLIKLKNRYVPGTCTSIINYYPGYVLK